MNSIESFLKSNFNFDIKGYFAQKQIRYALIIGSVVVLGAAGFYTYKWYRKGVQQAAQKAFSEAMETYNQALSLEYAGESVSSKEKETIWDEVEIAFKTGYNQNKRSTLAPFFLVYESEALLRQGKIDQSYDILSQAVNQMSKKSPYYYLYSIKQALFEIDKKDQQKGVARLNELIQDKNNVFKDMAAYYLAEYYWANKDFKKAKELYQSIDVEQKTDKETSSLINNVKMRLQQLQ